MIDIPIYFENDGTIAFVDIDENNPLNITLGDFYSFLRSKRIVYGINENIVDKIVSGKCKGKRVPVANGEPMIQTVQPKIEWFIDLSKVGKPKILENGRVDLRELQKDYNVAKGTKLVRCVPGVLGKAGMTVFGTVIQPQELKEVKIFAGKGTVPDPDDPYGIIADIDGAVIFDGYTVEVHNNKVIESDIDYSTGNISFNGDIKIKGTVRSGFSVSARGDIYIIGDVEDAEIKGDGSVIIEGGAMGAGNGTIVAGGSIIVHHVSKFSLSAQKDIIIKEDALHCNISSFGDVKAKSIIGGNVCAFTITAETAGSSVETRTVLDITRKAQLNKEKYTFLKQFGELSKEKTILYNKLYTFVKEKMDDNGLIAKEDLEELNFTKKMITEIIESAAKIQLKLEEINKVENEKKLIGEIRINHIYPNVIIKVDNEEKLLKKEERNFYVSST
ncbi:MAG: FapA family protein [Chitinispirillaceae bacterium]|nr:FapA family protein [Chitinispirillaceae bacterium]